MSGGASGALLSRAFYAGCVRPLLDRQTPGLEHVAARLGSGSDVLGLDDAVSRDHDWGPRLTLLVPESAVRGVDALLAEALPETFAGLPVRFAFSGQRRARHHVEVDSVAGFLRGRLGVDPRNGMTALDWLALTGQAVLEVVAGPVFHDAGGALASVRARLERYPDDVRRVVLAADWARIGEELPLAGRAGQVGDEAGSAVIAARIAHAAMHLAFVVERRWPPYAKWLGTAFQRLPVAERAGPPLAAALAARDWRHRQAALAAVLDVLRERQDGVPAPATRPFWDRPFLGVDPGIAAGLLAGITDPALRDPALRTGSAEQRTDLVPLLVDPAARRALLAPPGAPAPSRERT